MNRDHCPTFGKHRLFLLEERGELGAGLYGCHGCIFEVELKPMVPFDEFRNFSVEGGDKPYSARYIS